MHIHEILILLLASLQLVSGGVNNVDRVYSQIEADVVFVADNNHIHPVTFNAMKNKCNRGSRSIVKYSQSILSPHLKSLPGTLVAQCAEPERRRPAQWE